jgi:thiamine-phosphate pyrophosphorylase
MKEEPALAVLDAARAIAPMCRAAGVTFIVNDRVDVAMIAGADGVHIGQDDLPAGEVRRLMGPRAVIGVSAATVEEAIAAERAGADYLGVGAMYATGTKSDAGAPVGVSRVAEIRQAVRLPLVGIGGVTMANAAAVIRAGADGVAVITAVTLADDMVEAVRRLREAVDGANPR